MKTYIINTFWNVWTCNVLLLTGIIIINIGRIIFIQLGYEITRGEIKND